MGASKGKSKKTNATGHDSFCFQCFGVRIGIDSNSASILEHLESRLPEVLPVKWSRIPKGWKIAHWFRLIETKGEISVYRNDQLLQKTGSRELVFEFIEPQIRLTIAEYAESHVFLHAGVVSWKGKALIIPGKTFSGKTTLVSELVKRNCGYLSDEYAVIDENGLVHPFPKKISLRGILDEYRQVDFEVEEIGGKRRKTPVPVGYILLSEYQKENKRRTQIKEKTPGEGILATVANSISVRQNPKFVLKVLTGVLSRAAVFRARRGEASEFADSFLEHLREFEKKREGGGK